MALINVRVEDQVKDGVEGWILAKHGQNINQFLASVLRKEFYQNREAIADLLTATISAKVEEGRA